MEYEGLGTGALADFSKSGFIGPLGASKLALACVCCCCWKDSVESLKLTPIF
jgi:hypothetical protein